MKYFVPELAVAAPEQRKGVFASLLGRRASEAAPSAERLGGIPFGMPADRWPKCADCGKSQSLLAQLAHHPERLDLGREGRMLLVFQCGHDPGMCETWDRNSGANACLVLEPEEMSDFETPEPSDRPTPDNAVSINAWQTRDDGIDPAQAAAFFRDASYLALGESVWSRAHYSMHLGGVPTWIQSPDEAPYPGWRFLGQLDSTYSFLAPPAKAPAWVHSDAEQFEGRTHWGEGPNFGDGGIAYLFAREGAALPEVTMFWQCG